MKDRKTAEVFDGGKDLLIGHLHYQHSRSGGVFSFEYDRKWLASGHAFTLDPALDLYGGTQYPTSETGTFGIFTDSSPDRWGRVLMERREVALAKQEGRAPRALNEWDFLMGVDDEFRLGALRFRDPETGLFTSSKDPSIPHATSISEVQEAARIIENDAEQSGSEYAKWLSVLMAPGTSLGGARPKASFKDGKQLWIAKFPSNQDRYDIALFEKLMHDMARDCGINVPESRLEKIGSTGYSTFMCSRFDRDREGNRLMYVSAMTATGKTDGDGGSYLDIAEWFSINGSGKTMESGLEEMWKRIVFNIMTGNTDDHLRNHGFLMTPQGWAPSPAFDMNPNPYRANHAITIDGRDDAPDLALAIATADLYRLDAKRAAKIILEVHSVVCRWAERAAAMGAKAHDIAMVAPSFHTDRANIEEVIAVKSASRIRRL